MRNRISIKLLLLFLFLVFPVNDVYALSSITGNNSGDYSIPDCDDFVISPISITGAPANAKVYSIDIYASIIHPWSGDLYVIFTDENDYYVDLYEGSCEEGTDLIITTTITAYRNEPVNQVWKLWAADQCCGDTGYIDYWDITVNYEIPPNPPANLTGSPGPGSGEVTLQWNPSSGPDLAGYYIYRGTSSGNYDVYYDISSSWTYATLLNLTNGVTYYFAIAAYNSNGVEGDLSNEVSVVPEPGPAPPTGVTASPGPGSGEVTIEWNPSSGPDLAGYYIYRGTSPGDYDAYADIPSDVTGAVFFDLTNGVTYYFAVTAYNSNGVEGDLSIEVSAVPEPGPAPPTGVTASPGPGSGEVTIEWNPSSGPDLAGYYIYRGTSPGDYDAYYDISSSWTDVTLLNLTNGVTYYFAMTAYNSNGVEGDLSTEVSAVPEAGPAPPTGVTASPGPGSGEVTIKWNPSSGPDLAGYYIFRGISPGSYDVYADIPSNDTGAVFFDLTNDVKYYFAMVAYNSNGIMSALSTEVSAVPKAGSEPPTGVTANPGPGSGEVTISWNWSSAPYIDYYRIYHGTTSGIYDVCYDKVPKEWNTGTVLFNLTNDVTYYFAMTAVDTSGIESDFSNEASAMPKEIGDSEPPTDPTNLSIIDPGTGTELELIWDASTDNEEISHYIVFRLTNNSYVSEFNYDKGFPQYTYGTSYIDYELADSNTYYYIVQAEDTSGNRSGLSNPAWDSPDDYLAPSDPPYIGISAGDAVIDLWWTPPGTNTDGSPLTDLAGYNIYRGASSGNYDPTPINGSYLVIALSYTDIGLTNGQPYYYVISAVDYNNNEGPYSFEVSDTPQGGDSSPSPPTNLSITEKETELVLTWGRNYESDLAGYNVYRGTSSGNYSLVAPLVTYEWYADQNVVDGQTYYYVVTAVDNGDNESSYSNEVSGMIGQGEIWIISPTSSNPAIIDFGYQSQSIITEGVEIISAIGGTRVQINYNYNPLDRLISEIYMEIINSDTREIVYTESEWNPPVPWFGHDPYFIWDGKYSSKDECVPDGWYDTKLYLKVLGYFDPYAETIGKRNIQVDGCNASIIEVEFVEDTTQSYGFDDYTNPNVPRKSVKTGNSTDTAKAIIIPDWGISSVYFKSTAPANVTVSPNQASSSLQTITFTGIAKGESDIQANIGSEDGHYKAMMKVAAYNTVTKDVAIIPVNEENDDVQVIYPGLGKANSTAITAGSNGTLETTKSGDDQVVGATITTGSDGVCNTTKAGDDVQVIEPDQGQPYQLCVSSGANAKGDTNKSEYDSYDGEDITTGADGICNTEANNTDILSTALNETALQTFLNNTVYNQAVVSWTVTRRPDCAVNFDLNRDGMIDVDSWMTSEMQVIRDNCGDSNYQHNIFLVDNPSDGSTGFMEFNQRYGFVHVANSSEPYRTTAHELGHGAFGLQHTPTDSENIMYNYSSTTKRRLRKSQWDACNP